MFTRYWRTYPWFLQLFLFVTMMFTFLWLGRSVVWSVLPKVTGIPIAEIIGVKGNSALNVVRASLWANSLVHICVFTLPALLFAYLTHPEPGKYLGLRVPGKPIHWLLVTGIMIGFLPLSLAVESWLQQHLNLGQWAKDMQAETDATFAAYLNMHSTADLVKVFIAFAIVPPIGEELLFRGIIMRFAHRRSGTGVSSFGFLRKEGIPAQRNHMLMPTLLTAALFALMHPNPYGMVFIFIAGVLLSVIYWLTGSLLCSIWAHLLFNGTQVIGIFLSAQSAAGSTPATEHAIPIWLPIAGLLILAGSLYGLVKMKTPLPPDWSADYTQEELAEANSKDH